MRRETYILRDIFLYICMATLLNGLGKQDLRVHEHFHIFLPFLQRETSLVTFYPILTWKPVKGLLANSADSDQMPHYVASDLGLHCVLTRFSIKNRIKATIRSDTPKMTN